MDLTNKAVIVSINLSDVDCNEPLPDRIVSLSHPDYSLAVGRGSLSDTNIEPRPDNAWFSSRVMSRQHATLRANPITRMLTIQDDGSMHGTFLNGTRVTKDPVELLPADVLTFGNEVVRGEDTYQPLKISINFEWDENHNLEKTEQKTTKEAPFRNKFTVDFSEEDLDSELDEDDDIHFISSSIREPSVEILNHSAYKPQLSQAPKDPLPVPVPVAAPVTTTRTFSPYKAATEAKATHREQILVGEEEPYYTDYSEDDPADEDLGDDNSVLERELQALEARCYSDEDEGDEEDEDPELDSDIDESSFENDTTQKEISRTNVSNDNSATRAVALKESSTVLPDEVRREPSPSDAALARPRVNDPSPSISAKAGSVPVPPPPTVQANISASYGSYIPPNKYMAPQPYFQDSTRSSHSFVDSLSYGPSNNPVYSLGQMGSYSSMSSMHPWNLWKTTPPVYSTQQPSQPWQRPMTRFAPEVTKASVSEFSNHRSIPTDNAWTRYPCDPSPDTSRGQKRKADLLFDCSDDESVESMPISATFTRDSPAIASSSPVTNTSPLSAEVDKIVTANDEYSSEIAETSTCDHPSSTSDLNRVMESLPVPRDEVLVETTRVASYDLDDSETYSIETRQEPPRKKARAEGGRSIARQSRTSTAFKYTVTALAGATIGALGTVVGLASLPVDYFI